MPLLLLLMSQGQLCMFPREDPSPQLLAFQKNWMFSAFFAHLQTVQVKLFAICTGNFRARVRESLILKFILMSQKQWELEHVSCSEIWADMESLIHPIAWGMDRKVLVLGKLQQREVKCPAKGQRLGQGPNGLYHGPSSPMSCLWQWQASPTRNLNHYWIACPLGKFPHSPPILSYPKVLLWPQSV